jgi:nitrogen regulatory protein PII
MKLLILILNKVEKLEEVLEGFLEAGVTGATIIDTVGMGHILCDEVPIFAGLRFMFAGAKPHNKTVISVIKDEAEEEVLHLLENILGDMYEPGTGIVFTVPLDRVVGLKPEI